MGIKSLLMLLEVVKLHEISKRVVVSRKEKRSKH